MKQQKQELYGKNCVYSYMSTFQKLNAVNYRKDFRDYEEFFTIKNKEFLQKIS